MSSKKKQPTEPLLSEQVSSFLNLLTQAEKDYKWNFDEQQKCDKLIQDYLHKLELENLKYRERAKIATQLAIIRRQRRLHKDSIELLTPIIEFVNDPKCKQFKNLMNERLGQIRRAERYLGDRVYWFRVLQEPPIVDEK